MTVSPQRQSALAELAALAENVERCRERIVSLAESQRLATFDPKKPENDDGLLMAIYEAEPEANGGAQSDFDCQFEAIESVQPYRPERKSRKPHVKGPLPALVVGPEGREIHTDEFGRVKVQFYWDRYGKRNQDSSCWVRVATPAAGKGWGFIAIPRIGQEVVVSFEDGDPDRGG